MFEKFKAQGSLEYLLLISGAVLIAVIVVGIATSFVPKTPPNSNDAACITLSQTQCLDPFTGDVNGDGEPDCTWVGSLNECRACKAGSCP